MNNNEFIKDAVDTLLNIDYDSQRLLELQTVCYQSAYFEVCDMIVNLLQKRFSVNE